MITIPEGIKNIKISDYNYNLPNDRIAKYPLEQRDKSKLLIYKNGKISESIFCNLPQWIDSGSLMVFNNTQVIPARINFKNSNGADIEIFCLEPVKPANYSDAFISHNCIWKCMIGNLKKWKNNELYKTINYNDISINLIAKKSDDFHVFNNLEFTWDNENLNFGEIIQLAGVTPIPPYLERKSELIDNERYQTVYAKIKGSVASPTAGLHFTEDLLKNLTNKGIGCAYLTLHVGAGTFKPVKSINITDHEMHKEMFSISADTLILLKQTSGNLISVGTTTLRTLESLFWLGHKIKYGLIKDDKQLYVGQWDPYNLDVSLTWSQALEVLTEYILKNNLKEINVATQIMIIPGYKIHSINALVTNFHQPCSTLLLLLASITGDKWKDIYEYAMDNNFRFLSYGDSSLIIIDY